MLALFVVLATLSIVQGVVDVVLPALRGEDPFGFLFAASASLGPAFFGLYIFVHNMGLACLVPGFGFLAVYFEKKKANRGLIGALLAGAVVVSLLVALEFLLQSGRFNLFFALPLFALEAVGVLVLALPAARLLRGFVPTRRYSWSLAAPFARLATPLAISALLLGVASAIETWFAFS